MQKKIPLAATALATLAVLAAACSGGGGGSSTHAFTSGNYDFTIAMVSQNTCVDPGLNSVIMGITPTFAIVSTSDTMFTILAGGALGSVIPPIAGTRSGNDLTASGMGTYVVTTAGQPNPSSPGCTLNINATAPGTLTADNEFDDTITANISAANGSSCNSLTISGSSIPLTLTPPATGTCALALMGHAVKQ